MATSTPRRSPPLSVAVAASAIAGGIEPMITYPLEYLKTAQQLQSTLRFPHSGTPDTNSIHTSTRSLLQSIADPKDGHAHDRKSTISAVARRSWEHGGLRTMYQGVGALAVGGIAKASVRLGLYHQLSVALRAPDGSISGGRSLLAGMGAGLGESVLVVIPTETVKTKIIHATTLSKDHVFYQAASRGLFSATRSIYNVAGIRSLYAGVSATLCRQMMSGSIRFGSYTTLKNLLSGSMRPGQKLPSGITFGLGALSGLATVRELRVWAKRMDTDMLSFPSRNYAFRVSRVMVLSADH